MSTEQEINKSLDDCYFEFRAADGKKIRTTFSNISFIGEVGEGRLIVGFKAGMVVQAKNRYADFLAELADFQAEHKGFKILRITSGAAIISDITPEDLRIIDQKLLKEKKDGDSVH